MCSRSYNDHGRTSDTQSIEGPDNFLIVEFLFDHNRRTFIADRLKTGA